MIKQCSTYECADFSLSLHNRIGKEITLSIFLGLNVTNLHLPGMELRIFQILNLEFKALASSYKLTDLYITNIPSTISSLASCLSVEEITLAR